MALKIEREWAYVPMRMSECPACGEKVKAGVAVCKHCHAILNAETAAKHGLGTGVNAQRAESGSSEMGQKGTVHVFNEKNGSLP